jgi:hypothetical protein
MTLTLDAPACRAMTTTAFDAGSVEHGGFIVAAVHSRSRYLARIVATARERAAASEAEVVFLSVITRRPLSLELRRMREQLNRYSPPIHFVATWVDPDGLSSSALSSQVVIELIRGAQDLGASALVLGGETPSEESAIASRVAMFLPIRIELGTVARPGTIPAQRLARQVVDRNDLVGV